MSLTSPCSWALMRMFSLSHVRQRHASPCGVYGMYGITSSRTSAGSAFNELGSLLGAGRTEAMSSDEWCYAKQVY